MTAADFSEFRFYESADTTLDASDLRLGTLSSDDFTLGSPFAIQSNAARVAGVGITKYYLVTAVISASAVEDHAFKAGFASGDLATTAGGKGSRLAASDNNRVTIDVVATRLVYTTQPAGSVSGRQLVVQPVLVALDSLGFVDKHFSDVITLTHQPAVGTLLQNRATADSGVVVFSTVTYIAAADEESFALVADDESGGPEGDLPPVTSDTIVANAVNTPPVVGLIGLILAEDEVFSVPLAEVVTDADDSVFTMAFDGNHTTGSVVGSDIVLTPEPDFFGADTLTIIATDSFGGQGSAAVILQYNPRNDAPRVIAGPLSFDEDDTLRVEASAVVSDVDDLFEILTVEFSRSPGLFLDFDAAAGIVQLWAPPDSSGEFAITVSAADDGFGATEAEVQVLVRAVDDPSLLAIPPFSLLLGDSLTVDLSAFVSDVDDPVDSLVWEGTGTADIRLTIDGNAIASIVPATSFFGLDTLRFTATGSGGASATQAVLVDVRSGNSPPVFAALPSDTTAAPGDTLVLDLRPFVTDLDDAIGSLVWEVSSPDEGSASSVSIDGGILVVILADQPHTVTIQILVRDPIGQAATASLTIDAVPPLGFKARLPDLSFDVNRFGEIPLDEFVASGVSPQTLTWSTSVTGDLEAVISPDTRVVTVSAIAGWKGLGEIAFTAADPTGDTVTDTILVEVRNPVPSIDLPNIFLAEGGSTQLFLDDFAEDDEAVSLLTWSATPATGVLVSVDNVLRSATLAADTGFSGAAAVPFRATDVQGDSDVDTVLVTVQAGVDTTDSGDPTLPDSSGVDTTGTGDPTLPDSTNAAPVVVGLPQLSLSAGLSTEIRLDEHVVDDVPVGFITWSAQPDSGLLVEINPLTRVATVSVVAGFQGSSAILFTARDSQGAIGTGSVVIEVPPPPPDLAPGDFDGDGSIDLRDFFLLAENHGLSILHPDWNPVFDLDGNGRIDFEDLFLFADVFTTSQAVADSP